jgi:predicted aspartyl protease
VKRALSRAFDPPAAVLPLRASSPQGVDAFDLDGKLDTGADLCALPDRVVAELDLPPVRTVRAAGFAGVLAEAVVYRADLTVAGVTLRRVETLVTKRPYAIVGRNVLRHFVLRIDGPGERFELRHPR